MNQNPGLGAYALRKVASTTSVKSLKLPGWKKNIGFFPRWGKKCCNRPVRSQLMEEFGFSALKWHVLWESCSWSAQWASTCLDASWKCRTATVPPKGAAKPLITITKICYHYANTISLYIYICSIYLSVGTSSKDCCKEDQKTSRKLWKTQHNNSAPQHALWQTCAGSDLTQNCAKSHVNHFAHFETHPESEKKKIKTISRSSNLTFPTYYFFSWLVFRDDPWEV